MITALTVYVIAVLVITSGKLIAYIDHYMYMYAYR